MITEFWWKVDIFYLITHADYSLNEYILCSQKSWYRFCLLFTNLQTKMSKKYHPLGAHLTKNLRRAPLFGATLTAKFWPKLKFFLAHHQASEVTVLGKKFGISTKTWTYPQICLEIWHFRTLFWYFWLWTPITLARVDEMQFFFLFSPIQRDDGSRAA